MERKSFQAEGQSFETRRRNETVRSIGAAARRTPGLAASSRRCVEN
jgi:hypothetical protein